MENDQRRKPQPSRLESFFAITKSLIIRALIIYFISSFFRRPDNNSKSPHTTSDTRLQAVNIFSNGTLFDLSIYLSEFESFKRFDDPQSLIWFEEGLVYGDWYSGPNQDGSRVLEYSFVPSEHLKKNGSIYLHVYITKSGKSPNPKASKGIYASDYMSYSRKMLNKFKKIKYQKRHNLLTGESTASKEEIAVCICYSVFEDALIYIVSNALNVCMDMYLVESQTDGSRICIALASKYNC